MYLMKIYLFMALLAGLFLCSCSEDEMTPVNRDEAPSPVSDIRVENLPGGAKITYTLPKDKNLLYVKAVCNMSQNVQREVKSSYYQNYLMLDGFADTASHTVSLYTVSRGEKASGPVNVQVKPLMPPVMKVFKSLTIEGTFGGVRVYFENEAEANVVLTVLAVDAVGDLVQADAYYTKRKEGSFAVRGFEPVERKFGVFVRDRWSNCSDTLFADLTPVFEYKLDKTKFKHVKLNGDTYEPHNAWDITKAWDDITNINTNIFCTKPGSGLPQWFTFDLGVTTTLSRFKLHHRNAGLTDGSYTGGDPKIYEIWGSNDPDEDGGWINWTLLMTCESIKPSGLPVGTVTSEDKQFAEVDGEDFDFPAGIPPVRFLRFKTLKVWGVLDYVYFTELTLWGGEDVTLTDQ
jgi:hypothetical protein